MQKRNMRLFILSNFIVIALLSAGGCKVAKPANGDHPEQYFTVSLYSPGSGIDHEAHNIVINTIKKYSDKGIKIDYQEVHWGKEGEIDYCFGLQGLDPSSYKTFHDELTGLLKGRMVNILEQKPCRNSQ